MDAPTTAPPRTATRATTAEARRHFEAGGAVLVSERGHKLTQTVTDSTTTHHQDRTTWAELTEWVRVWSNRYPNQRYYLVPR